jgi:hypothetical protein
MEKVGNQKINKFSKYYLEIVQLVATGLLFLFVLNKELVIFIKEFISALPIGSSFVESIALRGYVLFNLLANSPSLVVFTFVFLQLIAIASVISLWIIIFCNPFIYDEKTIVTCDKKVEKFYRNNRTVYLETMRLLF